MDKPIFLIVFMGSGKTTLAKKIANALGLPFINLDQEIVNHIGMSISAYISQHGEEKLSQQECEFLRKHAGKAAVISTCGATPCQEDNMQWIKQHSRSLYLYHTPKTLWQRLCN